MKIRVFVFSGPFLLYISVSLYFFFFNTVNSHEVHLSRTSYLLNFPVAQIARDILVLATNWPRTSNKPNPWGYIWQTHFEYFNSYFHANMFSCFKFVGFFPDTAIVAVE